MLCRIDKGIVPNVPHFFCFLVNLDVYVFFCFLVNSDVFVFFKNNAANFKPQPNVMTHILRSPSGILQTTTINSVTVVVYVVLRNYNYDDKFVQSQRTAVLRTARCDEKYCNCSSNH